MFEKLLKMCKKKRVFEDPYLLCENSSGVSVEMVAYRPFYDSQWKIKTPNFTTIITRWEGETGEKLLKMIEELSSLTEEEIRKLDEKNKIWYD